MRRMTSNTKRNDDHDSKLSFWRTVGNGSGLHIIVFLVVLLLVLTRAVECPGAPVELGFGGKLGKVLWTERTIQGDGKRGYIKVH